MSMWSLRWHFTNKSVAGAPYSIKGYSYSLSYSQTLWWRVRWLKQCRLKDDGAERTDDGRAFHARAAVTEKVCDVSVPSLPTAYFQFLKPLCVNSLSAYPDDEWKCLQGKQNAASLGMEYSSQLYDLYHSWQNALFCFPNLVYGYLGKRGCCGPVCFSPSPMAVSADFDDVDDVDSFSDWGRSSLLTMLETLSWVGCEDTHGSCSVDPLPDASAITVEVWMLASSSSVRFCGWSSSEFSEQIQRSWCFRDYYKNTKADNTMKRTSMLLCGLAVFTIRRTTIRGW